VVSEAQTHGYQIAGVTVTNQRATVIPLGLDGRPLGPAISWQDTRGSAALDRFITDFGRERFIARTGLPPSALWSLAKILWLQDNAPEMGSAHPRFVLLHDYTLAALGADDFYTDPSNASVTGCLTLATGAWNREILESARLALSQFPVVCPAGTPVGTVSAAAAETTGIAEGTPLVVGGGDQQCGALGIGAVHPGTAGIVLGTAAVVSCPTDHPICDTQNHVFCTAHVVPGRWVIEGIHNTFGSAARWASLLLGQDSPEAFDALAMEAASGAEGVCFYPYLAGIGSPDFDAATQGAFLGVKLSTTPAEMARAVLEGTTLELRRVLDSLQPYSAIDRFVVAGGGAARPLRVQLLADVLGHPLTVNPIPEATLVGAAMCAWTGVGRFSSLLDAAGSWETHDMRTVTPTLPDADRDALVARYRQGIPLVRQFRGLPGGTR
jgi:sugar (pentulose or hexulose) kinase